MQKKQHNNGVSKETPSFKKFQKKRWHSIKFKLLIAFLVVILIWLAQLIYLASLHLNIEEEYKAVTDKLILTNNLSSLTPDFIQSYYKVTHSPQNNERGRRYNELHQQIEYTLEKLDNTIVDKESRTTFRGLSNYLMNIIAECDAGMKYLQSGEVIKSIQKYDEIIAKSRFIDENVGNLVAKELNYANVLQAEIEKRSIDSQQQSIGIILIITMFSILFSIFLANKIVDPLSSLSKLANKITNGHLQVRVDKKLLNKKDEIGMLSKYFESMLKKLNQEIDTQKKITTNLEKSRKQLEKSNTTLEKFNHIAIKRELKMIEMKKELEKIKKDKT